MRNLEDIERDLAAAREALSSVKGAPAEVYSRIVGYYRSVRNWNRGKREEYGERRLFRADSEGSCVASLPFPVAEELKLLLFVRAACPGCIPAKAAAERLDISVELVNTDNPDGIAEALRRNVLSTPTAILLSADGKELARAAGPDAVSRLFDSAKAAGAAATMPSAMQAMPVAELAIAV